jgi:hypothetical protein
VPPAGDLGFNHLHVPLQRLKPFGGQLLNTRLGFGDNIGFGV